MSLSIQSSYGCPLWLHLGAVVQMESLHVVILEAMAS